MKIKKVLSILLIFLFYATNVLASGTSGAGGGGAGTGDMVESTWASGGYLRPSKGGTGQDSSGATGFAYVLSGTWSFKSASQALTTLGLSSTDNVAFNTVTANEFISTCSPADNNCYVEAVDNGSLAASSQKAGRCYYDNIVDGWACRNNDNTVTFTVGARVDTKCTTIDNAVAASDYPLEKFKRAITILAVRVYQVGATNVIGGLDECTGTNGTCGTVVAVDSDITGTDGNQVSDDGSLSNPSIAAGNRVFWHTTSVSGTNTYLQVCFEYSEN